MALTDNLVSYWKLDESSGNAADSVGSNTLTNVNTATFSAGKINNGISLSSSSSQYFTASDNASLNITGASFTISMWLKLTSQPATNTGFGFVGKRPTNAGYGLLYRDLSGTKQINLVKFGVIDQPINYTLSNDTWYHIVAVQTVNTKWELFVNGTSAGSFSNGSSYNSASGSPMVLGATGDNMGGVIYFFNGLIDEVGIWSRALSAGEITTLYNGGAGLQYPFTTDKPSLFPFFNQYL